MNLDEVRAAHQAQADEDLAPVVGPIDHPIDQHWETIEEAEALRQHLVSEIMAIQAQLGDHGLDSAGYRMGLAEFESWRRRAKDAHRYRTDELRKVKAWIKDYNRSGVAKLARGNTIAAKAYAQMSVTEISEAIHDMTTELTRRARAAEREAP